MNMHSSHALTLAIAPQSIQELHSLSELLPTIPPDWNATPATAFYWYEGECPWTGQLHRLPRTPLAEAIAQILMNQLAEASLESDRDQPLEGKMYGILLVETPTGQPAFLKAFSGLLNGNSTIAGWVPPIPGREQVAQEEAQTLAQLDAIRQELLILQSLPERETLTQLQQEFTHQRQQMSDRHRQNKSRRQQQRQLLLQTCSGQALATALEQLDEESRQDGIELRHLKRQQGDRLAPLQTSIDQADQKIRQLKRRRKELSQILQTQMHAAYRLTNFLGQSRPLQSLMPQGAMPTGTGDCCAPKLLHYAATHNLRPVALAEFWWGSPSPAGDKQQGHFYGACSERCQPLMGFLLSGLPQSSAVSLAIELASASNLPEIQSPEPSVAAQPDSGIPIIYEDHVLIAINKPSGLLSVPGRYTHTQDSVLSRLSLQRPHAPFLKAVHRLDQDTSGLLLIAKDPDTHRHLSQQFQHHHVQKRYEALLSGPVAATQGHINLPLWSDPSDRPRQHVDHQHGKPSLTHFQVITPSDTTPRLEFTPITGRTHQLRVHAAHPQGLVTPILGDRLYGCTRSAPRLHLHARELHLLHPTTTKPLHLVAETPF